MNFSCFPLTGKLNGIKPILTMLVVAALLSLALIVLPFILLLAGLIFGAILLFARWYVARQLRKFRQQTQHTSCEPEVEIVQEKTFFERDKFKPKPHVGQVYEHGKYH